VRQDGVIDVYIHDHPLIDLYQALYITARANDEIYLSRLHRDLLAEAVQQLQRDDIDHLRRQATSDRLRLMARRSAAYGDKFEDVELALDALGFDFSEDCVDDELVGLYHDLVADDARGEPRYLSQVERKALMRRRGCWRRPATIQYSQSWNRGRCIYHYGKTYNKSTRVIRASEL
jgi:hypothetical protein